jgi:pilus assembly protein Flp/PilA
MKELAHRFLDNLSGVTAVEYGLIVALIALAIFGAVGHLVTAMQNGLN